MHVKWEENTRKGNGYTIFSFKHLKKKLLLSSIKNVPVFNFIFLRFHPLCSLDSPIVIFNFYARKFKKGDTCNVLLKL